MRESIHRFAPKPMEGAAFYCVTDGPGFLGAVGLLNSTRLLGHDEPFLLLDCGLNEEQRALLAPHAAVVPAPANVHPTLLKSILPRARPAEVMVLLDADVILLRHLRDLIGSAKSGRIVAFANDRERHCPEWGELLGLGTIPRRQYVNAGHIILPAPPANRLLPELQALLEATGLCEALRRGGSYTGSRAPDDPLYFADQDVLNALLSARVPDAEIEILATGVAALPPFDELVADPTSFRCWRGDGMRPYLLHHVLQKPWLTPLHDNVYAQLLRRLLVGDDLVVRVPLDHIPRRLRTGRLARIDQRRAEVQAEIRHRVRGRLGLRPRIQAFLATRAEGL